jgi:hypothetical protein
MKFRILLLLLFALRLKASPATVSSQWIQTSAAFGAPIIAMTSDTSGRIIAMTRDHLFRSDDSGTHWTDITIAFANLGSFTSIGSNGSDLIIGMRLKNNTGAVYRTTDQTNWTLIFESEAVLSVSSGPLGLFAGTVDGLYRNVGTSWNKVLSSVQLQDIATSASGDVYAATNAGIFHSSDSGRTFDPANGPITTIVKLAAIDSSFIFAETVFNALTVRSSNRGLTWDTLQSAPVNTNGVAIAVDSARNIYSAATITPATKILKRSLDSGDTWNSLLNGITDPILTSFTATHKYIYVGTTSGRIFRLQTYFDPPPQIVHTAPAFLNSRIIPNPARTYATLEFDLAESESIQIGLFDLLGRPVLTLNSKHFPAGSHSQVIQLGDLLPFEYIYQVRGSKSRFSGKLLIAR